VALGHQQLLIRRSAVLVWQALDVQHVSGGLGSLCRVQDPDTFAPGGGGEPARKRVRVADSVQLVQQVQPDALADILGSRVVQPVLAAD
jgi:hypothetical protein